MPSPESPQKRMTTDDRVWVGTWRELVCVSVLIQSAPNGARGVRAVISLYDDRHSPGTAIPGLCRIYPAFIALIRSTTAFLPSAKYISVLALANKGFGSPAKPGLRLRLITTTVRALSTSMIGMPAMAHVGSVRASGFTVSLAPSTIATSKL